jgi:hypothetical protein
VVLLDKTTATPTRQRKKTRAKGIKAKVKYGDRSRLRDIFLRMIGIIENDAGAFPSAAIRDSVYFVAFFRLVE